MAFFRPAKIYMPDGKVTLRNVDTATNPGANVGNQAYRAYNNRPCAAQDTRAECGKQPVYLVVDPQHAAQLD